MRPHLVVLGNTLAGGCVMTGDYRPARAMSIDAALPETVETTPGRWTLRQLLTILPPLLQPGTVVIIGSLPMAQIRRLKDDLKLPNVRRALGLPRVWSSHPIDFATNVPVFVRPRAWRLWQQGWKRAHMLYGWPEGTSAYDHLLDLV